jgi:metallo-beta-lactamase family protein
LYSPRSPERADLLVLESTYGDRLHEGRRDRRSKLKAVLEGTLENGGATIVPAFSLGRTQELLYEINAIFEELAADSGILG